MFAFSVLANSKTMYIQCYYRVATVKEDHTICAVYQQTDRLHKWSKRKQHVCLNEQWCVSKRP